LDRGDAVGVATELTGGVDLDGQADVGGLGLLLDDGRAAGVRRLVLGVGVRQGQLDVVAVPRAVVTASAGGEQAEGQQDGGGSQVGAGAVHRRWFLPGGATTGPGGWWTAVRWVRARAGRAAR